MKTGQQVHLTFSPDCRGTVSAVEPGRVRVTWPNPERGAPRLKVWYAAADAKKILLPCVS